ncbi:MAG: hypothetical protein LJE91_06750 [Gammaproteobacteria bacterium]|nr:hypothetical protein [Gammaproteobacteria bacterium]
MNIGTRKHVSVSVVSALAAALPGTTYARDWGFNQPGAVGNMGGDPGLNQPGAAGNVGGTGPGGDPGVNQPGAAGNVGGVAPGRDRGFNQPGRLGGGIGR